MKVADREIDEGAASWIGRDREKVVERGGPAERKRRARHTKQSSS